MKFKEGDKVKIKNDCVATKKYGSDVFFFFLSAYKGKIATIKFVMEKNRYSLDIDNELWAWTDGMLEPVGEQVNHPEHYNQGKYEVIDEMRILFGDEAVKTFCRLNVYKYFRRAELKGKEEDKKKAEWYLDYLDSHGWQYE